MPFGDSDSLEAMELRLRTILPEQYQDCYNDVQPFPMGSASLKYGSDGKVAWDQIWRSFCDLAMAGGPPHKGTLLESGSETEIDAQPQRYVEVVDEICRGISLVTDLTAFPCASPGWVSVHCATQTMAEWLARAIVMENISARCEGPLLDLPAGPDYLIAREIKNVITAMAKTSHYWNEHMSPTQHRRIGDLFLSMSAEFPLIQPAVSESDCRHKIRGALGAAIRKATGLQLSDRQYSGWLGVECPDVRTAIWMMRALVASNILSRREGAILFVPVNPVTDHTGDVVAQTAVRVHGFMNGR